MHRHNSSWTLKNTASFHVSIILRNIFKFCVFVCVHMCMHMYYTWVCVLYKDSAEKKRLFLFGPIWTYKSLKTNKCSNILPVNHNHRKAIAIQMKQRLVVKAGRLIICLKFFSYLNPTKKTFKKPNTYKNPTKKRKGEGIRARRFEKHIMSGNWLGSLRRLNLKPTVGRAEM